MRKALIGIALLGGFGMMTFPSWGGELVRYDHDQYVGSFEQEELETVAPQEQRPLTQKTPPTSFVGRFKNMLENVFESTPSTIGSGVANNAPQPPMEHPMMREHG